MSGKCFFFFRNATETDILRSMMCLTKEGGINDISRKFLVLCKSDVDYHLKIYYFFYNLRCLLKHILKNAQIILINNEGWSNDISNYRPVSVFINLSKVFENNIYTRLQSFCETSNFLAQNQIYFRKKTV